MILSPRIHDRVVHVSLYRDRGSFQAVTTYTYSLLISFHYPVIERVALRYRGALVRLVIAQFSWYRVDITMVHGIMISMSSVERTPLVY